MSERCRPRKQVFYADENYVASSEASDEYIDEEKKKKKKNSKKKLDPTYNKNEKTYKQRVDKSKQILLGPMACTATLISDISPDDLTHSPSGDPCRFIKYDQLKEGILQPSKYMKDHERGINTILPRFIPQDHNKLQYFGYESDIVSTDINKIKKMTDEELDLELERIDKELEKYHVTGDCSYTVVPAFNESINNSIAINCDVRYFNFEALGRITKFDVITMDPPWQIALSTVTRGVAISYDQLDFNEIASMPIHLIQDNGYIFIWVIACELANGIELLKKWGYEFVTYLNWSKVSKYGRFAPSHGYYLQHNKETCLIGKKGRNPENMRPQYFQDLIIEQRGLRQSHKPSEIYELIENVFPDSMYIEIFARPHNLREGWVSLGIELPQ